jgi:hypothetical protein
MPRGMNGCRIGRCCNPFESKRHFMCAKVSIVKHTRKITWIFVWTETWKTHEKSLDPIGVDVRILMVLRNRNPVHKNLGSTISLIQKQCKKILKDWSAIKRSYEISTIQITHLYLTSFDKQYLNILIVANLERWQRKQESPLIVPLTMCATRGKSFKISFYPVLICCGSWAPTLSIFD